MAINQYSPKPSKVLFIDENYLINTTEVTQNLDAKIIRTSIQYNQDRYILPILGSTLFEKMKTEIYSGVTLSGDASAYLTSDELFILENWVQPTLSCAVMMQLVFKMNFQFRNKGVELAHSENSTNATDHQLEWLSESYREQAAFYAQRLTQFLMANPDKFLNWLNPALGQNGTGADLFYPSRSKYFCGIHLPTFSTNVDTGFSGIGWGMSVAQRAELLGLTNA